MATLYPFDGGSPERMLLKLLIDGMISTPDAAMYLASLDFWRTNYPSFPTDTFVGVWIGITYTGSTIGEVSDAISTADPNAKPFIGFVPLPAPPVP